MSDVWYEEVDATTRLTQGDLILNCPLIAWKAESFQLHGRGETELLQTMTHAVQADVVVMTQACDLEYEKVSNVVLCPHYSLSEFHEDWQAELRRKRAKSYTESLEELLRRRPGRVCMELHHPECGPR